MDKAYAAALSELVAELVAVPPMREESNMRAFLSMMRLRHYDLPEKGNRERDFVYWYEIILTVAPQPEGLRNLADVVWEIARKAADGFYVAVHRLLIEYALETLDQRFDLIDDVATIVLPEQCNDFYRAVANDVPDSPVQDVAALIGEVQELVSTGPRGSERAQYGPPHPLIRLTEAVADAASGTAGETKMRRWSNTIAQRIDERASNQTDEWDALSNLRAAKTMGSKRVLEAAGNTTEESAILIYVIDPYSPSPERYVLRSWMYLSGDDEPTPLESDGPAVDLDTIRTQVFASIEQVSRRLFFEKKRPQIELEFVLPRELLYYPVEDWFEEPSYMTLGTEYVVVVRDLFRWRRLRYRREWETRWESLSVNESHDGACLDHWITCADAPGDSGTLYLALKRGSFAALGLTFPPPPKVQRKDLDEALNAGLPIAVWPRRKCDHPDAPSADTSGNCLGVQFKATVSSYLTDHNVPELRKLIHDMRLQKDHPHLALLWDDPYRVPADGFIFGAPAIEGES
jgi:hypothetical protein